MAWMRELGLGGVEVSDGTLALAAEVKGRLIRRCGGRVHRPSEVGNKDADFIMAPYVWVEQIEADLRGGRLEGDRRGPRVGHGGHLRGRRGGPHRA